MMGKGMYVFLAILVVVFEFELALAQEVSTNIVDCSSRSDSTCEGCLNMSTDIEGNDDGKKSDCAWFVHGVWGARCIRRSKCSDRGFEGGRCIIGETFADNSNKCPQEPIDICPRRKNCKRCLKGRRRGKKNKGCAWSVDGETASCIAEDKCEGNCIKSSETFHIRNTCRRLKKPSTSDEVGIKECTNFHGMCTNCLNNGCFWVNQLKECVADCSEAPADIVGGCQGTTPTKKPVNMFTGNPREMCNNFKLEDKNNRLCSEQNGKGCEACIQTRLQTAPNEFYIELPTCKYFSEGNFCAPYTCVAVGCGTDTCINSELPPEFTTWPELLGNSSKYAIQYLNDKYGVETLDIEVVLKGKQIITSDYRLDRVRLYVDQDDGQTIVEIPKIG